MRYRRATPWLLALVLEVEGEHVHDRGLLGGLGLRELAAGLDFDLQSGAVLGGFNTGTGANTAAGVGVRPIRH